MSVGAALTAGTHCEPKQAGAYAPRNFTESHPGFDFGSLEAFEG